MNPEPLIYFQASAIHGLGGFAAKEISEGARVLEYRGEKIDKAESLRRCSENNQAIFYLDELYDLDGHASWNPARLLNHSCSPNCSAEKVDEGIWIVAKRSIFIGEELTFNYSYDLESFRDYPCHCRSSNCVGHIVAEEFFPIVKKISKVRNESADCIW